jgi:Chromo (CHRromatin Organisation MOdifier) domain
MIWQDITIGGVLQPLITNSETRCILMQVTSKQLDIQKIVSSSSVSFENSQEGFGNGAYCLKLPQSMSHLHPVFNVIKLTLAPSDPISWRHPKPPLPPEIVDREEEWVVEEVLDSKVINWKLHHLVKWEGFRIEHNSWKPWDSVECSCPELIVEFYWKHPGAARQVRAIDFSAIPFHIVLSRHF